MAIEPMSVVTQEGKADSNMLSILLQDSDAFPEKGSIVTVTGHEGQFLVVNTKSNDEGRKEVALKII